MAQVTEARFGPGRLRVTACTTTQHDVHVSVWPDRVSVASAAPGARHTSKAVLALPEPPPIAALARNHPCHHPIGGTAAPTPDIDDSIRAAATAGGLIGTVRRLRRVVELTDPGMAYVAATYATDTFTCILDATPWRRDCPSMWTTADASSCADILSSVAELAPARTDAVPPRVIFAGRALDLLLARLASAITTGASSTVAGRLVDDPTDPANRGARPWDDLGFGTRRFVLRPIAQPPVRPGAADVRDGAIGFVNHALHLADEAGSHAKESEASAFFDVEPVVDDLGDGLLVLRGRPVVVTGGLPHSGASDDWFLQADLAHLGVYPCRVGPPSWRAIAGAFVDGFRLLRT